MKNINLSLTSLALFFCVTLMNCGSSSTSSDETLTVAEEDATITVDGAGAKLDNGTELQTGFTGFGVEKVFIVDGDDKRISTSEVPLNSTFSIIYEGVKNYTLKDGKAFPTLSMVIMDDQQVQVLSNPDLFASNVDGFTEADASTLRATVTVGDPFKQGKYTCAVTVLDKNNGNSSILSTWEFQVK
jgi:hypothetical protein